MIHTLEVKMTGLDTGGQCRGGERVKRRKRQEAVVTYESTVMKEKRRR